MIEHAIFTVMAKKKSLAARRKGKKCNHGFRKGSAKCRKHPKRRKR